jgi:hypothetical protein
MVSIKEILCDRKFFVRCAMCTASMCVRLLIEFQKIEHHDCVGLDNYIVYFGKVILLCDCVTPGKYVTVGLCESVVDLNIVVFLKTCLVTVMWIFGYMLDISKEANLYVEFCGVVKGLY